MPTFSRTERLKSRKLISRLFRDGHSYVAYPLKVLWLAADEADRFHAGFSTEPAQLAVSVPRRAFKTAVARNLLKRRIREAYRLHKHLFYEKLARSDQQVALMLVYIGKEELPFATIETGVKKMITKFG
ncbi:MAG: ribonuclease P protein component [Saprospiraceae bacterium]|nr:ribonuclease P protein component [Saprospiraceae bacterium]